MRSTFYGLEISRTGLYISQKGLDVTGHNIANVDTAGYTRQRLSLQSIDPYNATLKMRPLVKGLIGGGVQIQMVEQIRNEFLDRQFRTEQSNYSRWATRTTGLTYLESLFDDINDSGVTASIRNLFNAFDDLVHSSSDQEQRTITRQAAITMMASIKSTYDSMITQHQFQNEAVKGVADEINNITDSLAVLNEAIARFERDGDGMQKANDLRDKRNLLLDQLSALIDINYYEDSQGHLTVETAGKKLVEHTKATQILCAQVKNPLTGDMDLWELDLNGVILDMDTVKGGELKGHLELRDNGQKENAGIPYFIDQLNKLAQALVTEINAIHRQGYTHPDAVLGTNSVQGINFFDVPLNSLGAPDISLLNASNMKLSADVDASIWNIACSSTEIDLSDPNNAKAGNQENSLRLSALYDSNALPNASTTGVSSFHGAILSMVAEYTSVTHHSKTLSDTLSYNVLNIDNNRLSVSGVSLDEEMTNMIRYQHAYNGASRVITAMDEALETLINRMGLVGRS